MRGALAISPSTVRRPPSPPLGALTSRASAVSHVVLLWVRMRGTRLTRSAISNHSAQNSVVSVARWLNQTKFFVAVPDNRIKIMATTGAQFINHLKTEIQQSFDCNF